MAQQAKNDEAIKKLDEQEEKRQQTRKELIEKNQAALKTLLDKVKSKNTEPAKQESLMDAFNTDENWIEKVKKVIDKRIVPYIEDKQVDLKPEKVNKKFFDTINDFDKSKLNFEHLALIDQMIKDQKKICLSNIIDFTDFNDSLPPLLSQKDGYNKFSQFLKLVFYQATIQMVQVGSLQAFKKLKKTVRDVLTFCKKSDKYKSFYEAFVKEQIMVASHKNIEEIKGTNQLSMMSHLNDTDGVTSGVNPYLLVLVAKYVLKEEDENFLLKDNFISKMIDYLMFMAIYSENDQIKLVNKLLKESMSLLCYAKKNCHKLGQTDQLKSIIQNHLVKQVTSTCSYEINSDTKMSTQQILWLEIHLMIDSIQEEAMKTHNIHIGKVLTDSEPICQLKKNKQIIAERESFELLKYLYHLNHLDEDKKALVNVNLETNHPAFDTVTRAFVEIPEVQRVKVKFKENMKIKDLTYVGISNDPKKGLTLKNASAGEFEWPSANFYMFYPVYNQCTVGFGP